MSGIYLIINIANDIYYVGQAVYFERRFAQHRYELLENSHSNSYLQNAYNKYGKENFIFVKIEFLSNLDMLTERETYWINFYKSNNRCFGYNLRISVDSNKGIVFSEEIRKRMGDGRKGKKRKPFTEATKNKMRENGKKQKFTEDDLNRLRTINIGRKQTKEEIQKRVESRKINKIKNLKFIDYRNIQ